MADARPTTPAQPSEANRRTWAFADALDGVRQRVSGASEIVRAVERFIAHRIVPHLPATFLWLLGKRYIAGTSIKDAITTAAALSRERYDTTVDVLGEDTRTSDQASATVSAYLELLSHLARDVHRPNVSLKLSALGLREDGDECRRNLEIICRVADAKGVSVHIDMEQSAYTDETLRIYEELKSRYPTLGMTLQARLRRTLDDARWAVARRATVRLCKGIYIEPPSIAYDDPDEIRSAYLAALKILLIGGSYVEIATHDRRLLQSADAMVRELGIPPERYEFQMLLGVTRDGAALLRGGQRVRIYVPFGRHWRAYVVRRVHENPQIIGQVAMSMIPVRRSYRS